jgi:hypothetical protein
MTETKYYWGDPIDCEDYEEEEIRCPFCNAIEYEFNEHSDDCPRNPYGYNNPNLNLEDIIELYGE